MKRRMSGMSRSSLDQYQIPLRPLARGRRIRAFSESSQNGKTDYTPVVDDDDDNERLSTADEAPLIRKDGYSELDHTPVRAAKRFAWLNFRRTDDQPRQIYFGRRDGKRYPSNVISNAKYNPITFIPVVLYDEFKSFFNLYFLLVALSQAIPALRIGFLSAYIVPLVFVLAITVGREALDDIARRRRDAEANSEYYQLVGHAKPVRSRDINVGDLVKVYKDQRVPVDLMLLKTGDGTGEAFIRTDQLDGETDWKLRTALGVTQDVNDDELLVKMDFCLTAEPPMKDIHKFTGKLVVPEPPQEYGVCIDNMMWANTVLASGPYITGVVVYTGIQTRQAQNTSKPRVKFGLLEEEINNLSKILCAITLGLSILLVALHVPEYTWYISILRFLILFSTIIPISLRVNLDLGKLAYAYQIEHDNDISGTVVRTSTIPEELGRLEYLFTDKTGTITKNDMELKKLHVGTVSYGIDSLEDVTRILGGEAKVSTPISNQRGRREISGRVKDAVFALAVCHNVTPTQDDDGVRYQASSPDEIAIVEWCAKVGLHLIHRDRNSLRLQTAEGDILAYQILKLFPFTSESKRMGIIVRTDDDEIWFYMKGADTVMAKLVMANDWMDEECANMAREGLRTLVIGRRRLTEELWTEFEDAYRVADVQLADRDAAKAAVVAKYLEYGLEILGITGVEDKLQDDVKPSLELLRNAGIRIWMLTGDKVETARCVAVSSKLVGRGQYIHSVTRVATKRGALEHLEFLKNKPDACLLIDGESLQILLNHYEKEFIEIGMNLPAVVACRCSPTQKAEIASLIKRASGKRVCCIGDGGNDVTMIQVADVGVGIVGKEGRQASLAADFSITQFSYLTKLLVWHGRNSYKRSAKLAQFVIHRGLIISVCQTVYSITYAFAPIALYQGWLLVGYATLYTMIPVFTFVLDCDVDENLALLYPELYKELTLGKTLSYKTFGVWVLVSIYQGCAIMILSNILVGITEDQQEHLISVSFTTLVLNELIMIALEIHTWHKYMIWAEILTFASYFLSVPLLGDYFDRSYVITWAFVWKTSVILLVSLIPPWALRTLRRKIKPPSYARLQEV